MSFNEIIAAFRPIQAQELENLIQSGQKVIAFIGRETCPFCQRFAPKLATVQAELGAEIYFVDSTNPFDAKLNSLRSKYAVVTVPGLLVAVNQEVKVVCDSSLSEEAIREFIL